MPNKSVDNNNPEKLIQHMTECEQAMWEALGENKQDDFSNLDYDKLKKLVENNDELIRILINDPSQHDKVHCLLQYQDILNPIYKFLKNQFPTPGGPGA